MIEAEDLVSLPDVSCEAPPPGLRAQQVAQVRAMHRELNGNVAETARRLGVSRNTIYRALACGTASSCPDKRNEL